MGHPAFCDPTLHAAPGFAADDCCQVPWCQADRGGDRGERDRFVVVLLDELEHRRQQRLAAVSEVVTDVDRDSRRAYEEQRQMRQCCLGGAVTRFTELALDRRDVLRPSGPLGGRYRKALCAASGSADEREQQWV